MASFWRDMRWAFNYLRLLHDLEEAEGEKEIRLLREWDQKWYGATDRAQDMADRLLAFRRWYFGAI